MAFELKSLSQKFIFSVVLIAYLQTTVTNGFPDQTNDQVSGRIALGAAEQACTAYKTRLEEKDISDTNSQFPFMAALGYIQLDYSVQFECRGTIISDSFILIPAHCVPSSRSPSVVRLGKVDGDGEAAVDLQIKEIIRHPDYSKRTKYNDIALIRVAKSINFSDIASPACLQTDVRDESADVKLIWPKTDADGIFVRKVEVMSMPWAECNEKYLNLSTKALRKGQYCAYYPQEREQTCSGSPFPISGAPLLHFKNSNVPNVIGIVTFGVGCDTAFPTVHTRVAYYLDWIESVVWPNGFSQ